VYCDAKIYIDRNFILTTPSKSRVIICREEDLGRVLGIKEKCDVEHEKKGGGWGIGSNERSQKIKGREEVKVL
jgi:hypothetical protein